MPTNLPAEYYEVEERYKAAETAPDKIRLLEELMGTIPKHKGTDKLRADLRKRLSKLKDAAGSKKGTSRLVSPYVIDKEGAGQVAVIGPANVGKSTLIDALTNAPAEIGDYPYTTHTPLPGMMAYDNIQIQLIDTPPMGREYDEPQLFDLIRRVDLVLLMVDLQATPMDQLEETLAILAEKRIIPATLRGQVDEEARRYFFKPVIGLVNKTDDEGMDEDFEVLCELLGEPECPLIPFSAKHGRYVERFQQAVYDGLDIIRVYSRPPGKKPDFSAPFVAHRGCTVEEFAEKVHKDFVRNLKSARVWGTGVHEGQKVGRDHVLHDGDVVELRT